MLRNRNIWLLAAAFAGFIAVVIGSSTYLPTFLATQRGIPLSQAALLAAIPTLVTIFSAPGGGILSDRIGSRKKPYLVGIALAIVLAPLAWVATGPALVVVLVVTGLASGLVPMAIFSAAVEASGHERQGGMAMAIIMVGQNAGLLLRTDRLWYTGAVGRLDRGFCQRCCDGRAWPGGRLAGKGAVIEETVLPPSSTSNRSAGACPEEALTSTRSGPACWCAT